MQGAFNEWIMRLHSGQQADADKPSIFCNTWSELTFWRIEFWVAHIAMNVSMEPTAIMDDINILIVEDDEELKNLLQKRLLGYGFLTDAVENGEELLQKLDEKR